MPNFYFSRFRLNNNYADYSDKADAIYDGLDSKFDIEYRRDNFNFVKTDYAKEGAGYFVIGSIVKYKKEITEQIINTENAVEDLLINNKVIASAKFIVYPEAGIIVFEENKSYIPKDTFPKLFTELFEKNSKQELKIDISPITEENEFFNRIKEFKEIKKVVINLVPSNPSSRDVWKDIDDRLQSDRITNYKEILENKKTGEGILIDDVTESKFRMSEDGYGVSELDGVDNEGSHLHLSTKDSNLHVKISLPYGIEDVRELLYHLKDKIQDIYLRTIQ